jgi:hypothetical protein
MAWSDDESDESMQTSRRERLGRQNKHKKEKPEALLPLPGVGQVFLLCFGQRQPLFRQRLGHSPSSSPTRPPAPSRRRPRRPSATWLRRRRTLTATTKCGHRPSPCFTLRRRRAHRLNSPWRTCTRCRTDTTTFSWTSTLHTSRTTPGRDTKNRTSYSRSPYKARCQATLGPALVRCPLCPA